MKKQILIIIIMASLLLLGSSIVYAAKSRCLCIPGTDAREFIKDNIKKLGDSISGSASFYGSGASYDPKPGLYFYKLGIPSNHDGQKWFVAIPSYDDRWIGWVVKVKIKGKCAYMLVADVGPDQCDKVARGRVADISQEVAENYFHFTSEGVIKADITLVGSSARDSNGEIKIDGFGRITIKRTGQKIKLGPTRC